MAEPVIYLDYQATTPIDPAVLAAMRPWLERLFANPHSQHRPGWEAAAAIEEARRAVASLIGAPPASILFTSGATEANNLALKGVMTAPGQRRRRIVTVATEHSAVLEPARYLETLGAELTVLPVGGDGLLDPEALRQALDDDVALVSIMIVNNEIGVIQPIGTLAPLVHAHGALLHCDAAQAFGKLPIDVGRDGMDLLSISAHKIYGPKQIGALYVRPGVALTPLMHGGGQEGAGSLKGLHSGTLSPALCAGLGAAARVAADAMGRDRAHVDALWARVPELLTVPHRINGSTSARWCGNLNLRFPGVDGSRLLRALKGVAVSSQAACSSSGGKDSHVLKALGLSQRDVRASIRIGWGRFTGADEFERAMTAIDAAARLHMDAL